MQLKMSKIVFILSDLKSASKEIKFTVKYKESLIIIYGFLS